MVKDNFKNVVKQVQNFLKENTEWKERYSCYAKSIEANLPIINEQRKNFNQFNPLRLYITTGSLKDKKAVFSVRYLGQEVAKLSVKGENIILSTKGYEKNNTEHFGCNISVNNEDWTGKCASDFRKYFSNHYKNNIKRKNERKRNEEHRIESLLLAEFSKRSSVSKNLTGIQPVKIANACFPMPTPISASNHTGIKYSGCSGGGIDIFARVGKHPTRLCVIEVKDETVSKEPPIKATEQAVAYATFIRELLRHDPTWYKLFGFSGELPRSLTILASCAMPYNKDLYDTSFDGQIIDIDDNDKIELRYIYFEENNNNITKIDSSINKKISKEQ